MKCPANREIIRKLDAPYIHTDDNSVCGHVFDPPAAPQPPKAPRLVGDTFLERHSGRFVTALACEVDPDICCVVSDENGVKTHVFREDFYRDYEPQ